MSIGDWIPRGAGPVILKPMSDTSDRAGSANRFGSLYAHGFVRVAAAVPRVRVAEPAFNAEQTVALARRASEAHAALVVFPELGLSAYSNDDLFHQEALSDAVTGALGRVVAASADMGPVIVVGAPLAADQRLFNAADCDPPGRRARSGAEELPARTTASTTKSASFPPPATRSPTPSRCSERRCHSAPSSCSNAATSPASSSRSRCAKTCGRHSRPARSRALAGATVLANLSASNITIGKADYRRSLCASQSARTIAAYLYTAADSGESTTDLAWDGQALICENGDLLAESERFAGGDALTIADVDLDRLVADRAQTTSLADCAHDHRERLRRMRRIGFELGVPGDVVVSLRRDLERFPYVPADPERRDERCEEVYRIQVQGLGRACARPGIERAVIGVSGGLDSTQALIVAARTMDELGLAAIQRARLHAARLRHQPADPGQRAAADAGPRRDARGRSTSVPRRPRCCATSATRRRPVRRPTTRPTRTSRPASAPRTSSGSPTTTVRSWSGPATSRSSRSAGARTGSATRCPTTTSTPRCRRRWCNS